MHYNKKTKEITLKNQHLKQSEHKPPKANQAITINQLCRESQINNETFNMAYKSEHDLECHENFELPSKHRRNDQIINGESNFSLIRFKTFDIHTTEGFCQKIFKKKIVKSIYNLIELGNDAERIVEIECGADQIEFVLYHISQNFKNTQPFIYNQVLH